MGDRKDTERRSARTGAGHTGEEDDRGPGTERIAPVLTAAEAADLLGVTPMTVYRLIRSGTLTALRVGSVYRIPERVVRSYLAEVRSSREALRRPPER